MKNQLFWRDSLIDIYEYRTRRVRMLTEDDFRSREQAHNECIDYESVCLCSQQRQRRQYAHGCGARAGVQALPRHHRAVRVAREQQRRVRAERHAARWRSLFVCLNAVISGTIGLNFK